MLLFQRRNDFCGMFFQQSPGEDVGMTGFDAIMAENVSREILDIESDNQPRPAADCRRQDMPVVRIRQRQGLD